MNTCSQPIPRYCLPTRAHLITDAPTYHRIDAHAHVRVYAQMQAQVQV
jgi:hypothetical protein